MFGKNKTRVNFGLDSDLYEELVSFCKYKKMSQGKVLNEILRTYFKQPIIFDSEIQNKFDELRQELNKTLVQVRINSEVL